MARDVGSYAKKMKFTEGGTGKEVPVAETGSISLRPKHMVAMMRDGNSGEGHACPHCGEDITVNHEAVKGEDPAYHEAVKKFQTCYEGTKAKDADDEGQASGDKEYEETKGEKY